MKKIIISLAIIGVVAGITLGITGAWFTDEEPITGNNFQSGKLDIQQGVNDLPVTLTGLMPGVATPPQKLQMGNNGTLDAIIDKIAVTSWANDDAGTSDNVTAPNYAKKVNVTISDEVGRPVYKGTLFNLYNGNAIDGTDKVFLAKKGSGVNYTTRDYWFTFQLDSSVDNAYQEEGISATIAVNATQVKDDEFDAAERLVMNQNDDNGWDWVEDNDNSGGSCANLFGVMGLGMLKAYETTGNSDYFDAAEKAAYVLYNNYGSVDRTSGKWLKDTNMTGGGLSNFDILFLQRIGKYLNDGNGFTVRGEEAVIDRWDQFNNDAQEVYDQIKSARESQGYYDLFYWHLAPLMEATIDAANTVSDSNQAMTLRNNALALAELVAADQESAGHFITAWANDYARLGQASAIRILQLADDASLEINYSSEIGKGVNTLKGKQNSDGSFNVGANKSIQTTAYAALALEMTGRHGAAKNAVDYIISQQLSNGGWYEEEGLDEYPEINSEALRAIVSVNQ